MARNKPGKEAYKLACRFGVIASTKETVKIPIRIGSAEITPAQVHALVTNALVTCKASCDPIAKRDADGQEKAFDDDLDAAFVGKVGGYSGKSDRFNFSITIDRNESGNAGAEQLIAFANCEGRIEIERIGNAKDVPSSSKNKNDKDDEKKD